MSIRNFSCGWLTERTVGKSRQALPRRHALRALCLVIVIRTGNRPELSHFAVREVVEIPSLYVDHFARRSKISGINKAQSELVAVGDDLANVIDRVGAGSLVPVQAVRDVGVG